MGTLRRIAFISNVHCFQFNVVIDSHLNYLTFFFGCFLHFWIWGPGLLVVDAGGSGGFGLLEHSQYSDAGMGDCFWAFELLTLWVFLSSDPSNVDWEAIDSSGLSIFFLEASLSLSGSRATIKLWGFGKKLMLARASCCVISSASGVSQSSS